MTTASDNRFPKLIITEGTAPSSPSAGDQKLYIDSSDHHLKLKNSSGTVTDLQSAGAASYVTAHGCRLKRASTGQSVGNNTLTAIAFDAEDFDTDTMHDTSTNNSRITIPAISGVTTGLWEFVGSAYFDLAPADLVIKLNGTTAIGFNRNVATTANTLGSPIIVVQYVCSATDYVELYGRTPTGSGNVSYDAGTSPIFSAAFLGKVS